MKKFYRIVDNDAVIRDGHSKAILLTDRNILRQEEVRKNAAKKKTETEQRINTLEQRLDNIEALLRKLVNK